MVTNMLKKLEEKMGLPPLREFTSILSGENGKRIDALLTKLLKLTENSESLRETTKLMQIIREMGISGDLARLDSILKSLPKGKAGQEIIEKLSSLLGDMTGKIEKLSELAEKVLNKED